VGDLMLSRTVLRKMEAYGSYRHPFTQTADILRSADVTVANLEGQVSDDVTPSRDPHTFSFVSPGAVLDGVRWAGIDAVSLANNHTLDYGTNALTDTMRALDESGIGHFGAGRDREGAYGPRIFDIDGQRVAFLGFTDLSNTGYPHPSLPTPAPAHSPERVAGAVRAAEGRADVVIAYFHWGVEYTAVPDERQRSLAHAAVDAGADLVIGAHPHWVQTTERYKGKLIAYSLGNFVFDQMWSTETRRGVVATFTFEDSQLVGVRYTPVLIEDYNQPRVATGHDRDAVLERLELGE
jgi:poly-gamma-glutamate synthesis protein (capsule biosynthesis protein)